MDAPEGVCIDIELEEDDDDDDITKTRTLMVQSGSVGQVCQSFAMAADGERQTKVSTRTDADNAKEATQHYAKRNLLCKKINS